MLYTSGFMEGPCQGRGGGGEAKGPSYPQSHPQPQLTSISFVLKICQCVCMCVCVVGRGAEGRWRKGLSAVKEGLEMTSLFHLFVF